MVCFICYLYHLHRTSTIGFVLLCCAQDTKHLNVQGSPERRASIGWTKIKTVNAVTGLYNLHRKSLFAEDESSDGSPSRQGGRRARDKKVG